MKSHVNANWSHAILVCRKCDRKLKGGFGPGGTQKLAKALRKSIGGKGRKARMGVVEVGCLDVCPKGAVVVVDSRCPGVWRLVRPEADLERLAAEMEG